MRTSLALALVLIAPVAFSLPSQTGDYVSQRAYLKAFNTDGGDALGTSVSISGSTAIVGAPREESATTGIGGDHLDNSAVRAGAAYVFSLAGDNWTQEAYLKAPNTDPEDLFGSSVAISGDTAVVGAWKESSDATGVNGDDSNNNLPNSGAAYVYRRNGGQWMLEAYLKPTADRPNDYFGAAVAIDGDTIVVGAHSDNSPSSGVNGSSSGTGASSSGAAYIFVRSGSTWTLDAYLKAAHPDANDHFGASVAVHGDTVVIGAYGEDSSSVGVNGDAIDNTLEGAGAAYVFRKIPGTWVQEAYLKASTVGFTDFFGYAVSLHGDIVLVGSPNEDGGSTGINGPETDGHPDSGAAYMFLRVGGTWSQEAYIKASHTNNQDFFGRSVAIDGDRALVGATDEDSPATGINGNQTIVGASNSGATYAFARSSGQWSEQAYIKASNTGSPDTFGTSVSLSGGLGVVGARFEKSGSTDVDSNQADNSASGAGAAYVFDLQSPAFGYCEATPNSTGARGRLTMLGTSLVAANSFGLRATGLPPGQFGYFLSSMGQDFVTNPGGSQGNLCIGGLHPIGRHLATAQAAGTLGMIEASINLQTLPTPTATIAVLPGDTWNFQCWYRDQNPASTSNFTEALSVEFE